MIRVGTRDLVVLAGLPGAGKSTLLGKLDTAVDVTVLDSEQVHRRVGAVLGPRWPYRTYRGLVHLLHRLRILRSCATAPTVVVAHEPSTRSTTRAMLVGLGMLTSRPRVLVWLHVDPAVALAGQHGRGRVVSARSFARHVRRAGEVHRRLRRGRAPRGFAEAHVFTRADLDGGLRLESTE